MIKLFFKLTVLFSILKFNGNSHNTEKLLETYHFKQINADGIRMLVCQKNATPKPTIIFITGSGFNPFFINGNFYGFPFNVYPYTSDFNFVSFANIKTVLPELKKGKTL